MLTGPAIAQAVAAGDVVIEPFVPAHVNPNSVDLTLAKELLVYAKQWPLHAHYERHGWPTPYVGRIEPLVSWEKEETVAVEIPPEGFTLYPNVLYLAATAEYTESRRHVPRLEGRSSVGRLGWFVHVTAGFGDVGFRGDWTCELVVVAPLRVKAGTRVCQINFTEPVGEVRAYAGKYQGQRGPKASGLWKDFLK